MIVCAGAEAGSVKLDVLKAGKMGTLAVNMPAESMPAGDMAAEDIAAEGMAAERMLAERMAAASTRMRNCDFVDISVGQRGSTLDKTEQHQERKRCMRN